VARAEAQVATRAALGKVEAAAVDRGRVIERLWNYLTSLFKILNCPRANERTATPSRWRC